MIAGPVRRWPTERLGKLADFRNGVNYNKGNFGRGIKVLGVSNFHDYIKPKYEELDEIDPVGVVTESSILRDGDIVFVRSNGNRELIGRSLVIDHPPEQITHSAFTIRVRFTSPEADPRFYAYFFRTPLLRGALSAHGGGTNINNLNQDILAALEVPFPDLSIQRRIAEVLSAYDDLIENNVRRIGILEQMVRALYQEWFLDFRFPGHEKAKHVSSPVGLVPAGWQIKSLDSLAEQMRRNISKGRIARATPYVGLEHIPRRSLALDAWETVSSIGSTKLEFKKGEVLFGKIRPYFHKVSVAPFDGLCSADTIVIRPRELRESALVVACVSSDAFVAHASATANGAKMPRANWDVLKKYDVVVPATDTLQKFSELVTKAIEQQQILIAQVTSLRRTRDLLVPRLMSSEITLNHPAA